ncbi:MAG TPA: histidine kinase [Parafilimonas sp.]|nr:histidine kinase [Parafilimonas sp.]
MWFRSFLLLLLIPFAVCEVYAQAEGPEGQYPFVHYTPKDGLVNSRVRKAFQDSKGRIYFITYGGLSVFDGARFRNYTTQNGLASDVVNDIFEAGDDSFLVATNSGYFVNVLVKGKLGVLNKTDRTCPVVNQFYLHDDHKIYVASDNGLFVLENKKFLELNTSSLSANGRDIPYVSTIAGIGNYLVLSTDDMSSHKGLYLYNIMADSICDFIRGANIFIVGKDSLHDIWITRSDKLFVLDPVNLSRGKIVFTIPPAGYERANTYSSVNVAFDRNSIWMVYRNKDNRSDEIQRIPASGTLLTIPLPEQMTSFDIGNIMIDKENTIWLCNDGEGVFKIINTPLRVFANPFAEPMQGRVANVFCADGSTWYSTNTNKLFCRSSTGSEKFICNVNPAPAIFFRDGNRLLAHDYNNIYESVLKGGDAIEFKKTISLPASDFFGKELVVDRNGAIVSSQRTGLGVWKNKKLIFLFPVTPKETFDALKLDSNNMLWAVTRYSGVHVFSIHPEDPSHYLRDSLHFDTSRFTGSPRCATWDKNGLMWIGTRNDGLFAYGYSGNRLNEVYHFNIENGLTDNFVTTLACDSLNNIIVGTQTGLDRIVRSSNSYRVENLSKSSNFFAFIKQAWADEKQAYGLTSSGMLLQLASAREDILSYEPKLLLDEMRVNGRPTVNGESSFKYRENNISFFVAAPSFIDENRVSYSYRLAGSGNQQWSDTSPANSVINLTNLSAANYTLTVKAFFPSAAYAPVELSYSFAITPPWWETWPVRVIAALLFIAVLILAIRFYYRRKLDKQKTVLEKRQAIEKERTRIATDMHDDLGAGLTRIKFLSETIGIKKQQQQPIEEDITRIREYSHEMIDKMGEIVWALNEKNDTLSDLLSYTRAYAVEYLSQNGIHCTMEIPESFPSTFVSGEFRRNIYLTVKEALHNVVKHSAATEVIFKMRTDDQLIIEIKDNGCGFEQTNLRMFSNGITNMNTRTKELGGGIDIINDNGTDIIIRVPIKT